jgi:hypothetical protein
MTDKSINPSERLEKPITEDWACKNDPNCVMSRCVSGDRPCFLANNRYASGINPTHCTETQYVPDRVIFDEAW